MSYPLHPSRAHHLPIRNVRIIAQYRIKNPYLSPESPPLKHPGGNNLLAQAILLLYTWRISASRGNPPKTRHWRARYRLSPVIAVQGRAPVEGAVSVEAWIRHRLGREDTAGAAIDGRVPPATYSHPLTLRAISTSRTRACRPPQCWFPWRNTQQPSGIYSTGAVRN